MAWSRSSRGRQSSIRPVAARSSTSEATSAATVETADIMPQSRWAASLNLGASPSSKGVPDGRELSREGASGTSERSARASRHRFRRWPSGHGRRAAPPPVGRAAGRRSRRGRSPPRVPRAGWAWRGSRPCRPRGSAPGLHSRERAVSAMTGRWPRTPLPAPGLPGRPGNRPGPACGRRGAVNRRHARAPVPVPQGHLSPTEGHDPGE